MSTYQLEIKQIVDYPRCRMYREFVQTLIADRSIHTRGCSGLFHFTVLCSYANFRTSYRRLDGISYTVYPGEWVCRLAELCEWLRLRTRKQVLAALERLQERGYIALKDRSIRVYGCSGRLSRSGQIRGTFDTAGSPQFA